MSKEFVFPYKDVFRNSPACNETDQLYRYFLRILPDQQRREFETHLSSCETCMDLLMQLSESENIVEKTIMDAVKADRTFDQVRVKLQDVLKTKYGRVSEPPANRTYRRLIFLNATLLLVIAVLIYPAYRSTVLHDQLERLQSDVHSKELRDRSKLQQTEPTIPVEPEITPMLSQARIYRLHLKRGVGEESKIELAFDKANPSYTLIFAAPPDYDSYGVDIVRQERVVWHNNVRAIANQPSSLISIQLNAAYFQDGEYSLQIAGHSAEARTKFQPYTLIVTKLSN